MSTNPKPTFDEWLRRCDAVCQHLTGMSYHDLPDIAWRDLYDDGEKPVAAVRVAISEAGECCGENYL